MGKKNKLRNNTMSFITQASNVYWLNDSKTRVSAHIKWDDGTTEQMSVAVTEGSMFWDYIKSNVPVDVIDSNTAAIIQRGREDRKINKYRDEERQIQKRQNAIFNAKIEAFDMTEVANALPTRKTKIRKAKSVTEVMAHVALCVIEYEQKQQ